MISPELRLRRAIHNPSPSSVLLLNRILKTHPHLLHNPDSSPTGLSNTSLHLAASLGNLAVVQSLLDLGHERESISLNEIYQTPLMLAAREGHTDIVLLLCKENVGGIEKRDRSRRDAIMQAAEHGHDTCVQILLTYAAAGGLIPSLLLKNADCDGNTALHFASSNGHLLVLRTLLAAGADPDVKNVWSWSPVAYSATVSAEVYFKGLVGEVDGRREKKREAIEKGTGAGIRVVTEPEES